MFNERKAHWSCDQYLWAICVSVGSFSVLADSDRVTITRLVETPVLGRTGVFSPMTNAFASEGAPYRAPSPVILPPALNGYRRSLYTGRAANVYFDQHPPNEWREHTHEQDQISGIVGAGSVRLNCKSSAGEPLLRELGPDTWWVIPRGMVHALNCAADTDMVTLFMETSFVAEILQQNVPEFVIAPLWQLASRDQLIPQHAKSFLRLCRGQLPANALYIESVGTVLGTHILQTLFPSDQLNALRAGLPDEALARVMAFIEAHYGRELPVDELAGVAGYSSGHFTALFKRSMTLTPHDYLMRHRLMKAWDLLGTTRRKEIDIAHACGFSDDTHLARHVREVLKCQPRQLRGSGPSDYRPIFPDSQPIPSAFAKV
jgi:AraC family transcriptional regulator